MSDTIFVPIAESQYLEVQRLLEKKGVGRSPSSVIQQFIDYGIDNAAWKGDVFFPEIVKEEKKETTYKELVWKHPQYRQPIRLFHGAQLRMKAPHADYKYAVVENGKIKYEGKLFKSASQLARYIANGTSRSAPRDIDIKQPNESDWKNALNLFKEINK
jgi:hypothetical protein